MALFGRKNNKPKEQKAVKDKSLPTSGSMSTVSFDGYTENTLIKPRITEKAALGTQNGVYVFQVDPRTTKKDVFNAVKKIYKVEPEKVNTVKIPKKMVFQRRIKGVKGGGKKAYVYLKEGDKIDLI